MNVEHLTFPCEPCWWNPTGKPIKYTKWSSRNTESRMSKYPPLKYAEVEKAEAEFAEAKRKLDEVKNGYLASNGWHQVFDFDAGTIRWAMNERPKPDADGGQYMYYTQADRDLAMKCAKAYENRDKAEAERKIAELKAEHGIGEGE